MLGHQPLPVADHPPHLVGAPRLSARAGTIWARISPLRLNAVRTVAFYHGLKLGDEVLFPLAGKLVAGWVADTELRHGYHENLEFFLVGEFDPAYLSSCL